MAKNIFLLFSSFMILSACGLGLIPEEGDDDDSGSTSSVSDGGGNEIPFDDGEDDEVDLLNGANLSAITSHWAANPCIQSSVKVAFAADGNCHIKTGAGSSLKDHLCTWSSQTSTTVLIAFQEECQLCLSSLVNISGGSTSLIMTAKGYRIDGYSPPGETCNFSFISGDFTFP